MGITTFAIYSKIVFNIGSTILNFQLSKARKDLPDVSWGIMLLFFSGCVVRNDAQPFAVLAIFEKEETRAIDLINGETAAASLTSLCGAAAAAEGPNGRPYQPSNL